MSTNGWIWYQVLYAICSWIIFILFAFQISVAQRRFALTGKHGSSVGVYFQRCGLFITLLGVILIPDPVGAIYIYPVPFLWFIENNQSSALFSAAVYLLYRTIGINYQFGTKMRVAGPPAFMKLSFIFIVSLTWLFGNAAIVLFAITDSQFATTGLYAFWFVVTYIGLVFILHFGLYHTRRILKNLSRPVKPSDQTSSRKQALRNLVLIQVNLQLALIFGIFDRIFFGLSTVGISNSSNFNAASTVLPWLNFGTAALMLWYSWIPMLPKNAVSERPKTEVAEEEEEEDEMLTFTAMLMGKRATNVNFSPPKSDPSTPKREIPGHEIELLQKKSNESSNVSSPSDSRALPPSDPLTLSVSISNNRLDAPGNNDLVWNLVMISEEGKHPEEHEDNLSGSLKGGEGVGGDKETEKKGLVEKTGGEEGVEGGGGGGNDATVRTGGGGEGGGGGDGGE